MALTKCINSESKQYKPVLVDKLILDDVPTVNSLNAITSDAVARAVAGASGEVPQVTENDNGKVLKAIYDAGGPAVEWGEAAPAVTVDQTYNALSENPQSGVAVAEAIAAIPSSSYTAGNGLKKSSNEFSVKAGNGISFADAQEEKTLTLQGIPNGSGDNAGYISIIGLLNEDIVNAIEAGPITINITFEEWSSNPSSTNYKLSILEWNASGSIPNISNSIRSNSDTSATAGTYTFDLSSTQAWGGLQFSAVKANPQGYALAFVNAKYMEEAISDNVYSDPVNTGSMTIPVVTHNAVAVTNPLPASTSADATKVLTVNASGNPEWQTAQGGGSSYTAGTGIKINNDEISAKFGLNSGLIADWNYDTVATEWNSLSGYSQMATYKTAIEQLQITTSYCGGRLCVILRPARFSGSLGFRDTGLDQSTGWTVIAYDSSDPANKYAYATESYPYESTSSSGYYKAEIMEARSNKPDKYFVFTFSNGNVHGDLSANSTCFAVVPKPGEGFTGTSPWGVPVAGYIQTEGIITNADGWSCPGSGSGTVDYNYLKIQRAIPSYNKRTDVGKVIKVQSDGTLAWALDGFTTTAGITDIQKVNALPANPVATVLYLIPET